ncbi:MAG: hypothetical protein H7Z43_11535 [Clostridia bacterium]|nr:hypothetical protein [Deltaproteobacteria bacterium]
MHRALTIGLLFFLVTPAAALAKPANFAFSSLVEDAEFIAVGRVVAIDERTRDRIADVVVEERVFGDVGPVVRIDTHATWTCDTSATTNVGDRGLMFLSGLGAVKRFTRSGAGFVRLRDDPVSQLHVGPGPIIWPPYLVEQAGHSTEVLKGFEVLFAMPKPAEVRNVNYLDFTLRDVVDFIHGYRVSVPYR